MERIRVLKLGPALILLLALGCTCGVAFAENVYTSSDSGKTLTVSMGETFIVKLPENPSTGYSWNLTAGSGLEVISDQYVPDSASRQIVGSGGYHTWTILASSPGTSAVSGIYKRPWEPASASDERFTLNIIVTLSPGSTLPAGAISKPYLSRFVNLEDDIGFTPSAIWSAVPDFGAYLKNLPDFGFPEF
jgi:inhibitor of cysteine peptidase